MSALGAWWRRFLVRPASLPESSRQAGRSGRRPFLPARRVFLALLLLPALLAGLTAPAAAQTPSVSIAGGSTVTEGADATFTLTASPAPSAPITVNVKLTESGHFALYGQFRDFQSVPLNERIEVTVGTGGTASFTVSTFDDGFAELHGAINAAVQSGDGYSVGSPSSASVTVKDNDSPDIPDKVSVSIRGPSTITEGTESSLDIKPSTRAQVSFPMTIRFTRTGDLMRSRLSELHPGATQQSRNFETWLQSDGTGKAAFDYVYEMRHVGQLIFSGLITANDGIDEPDGVLTAVVRYAKNGATVTSNSVTLSIRDNDPTVVSLARVGAGAVGAGEAVAFTVTLGRALMAGETVDVPLAISGKGARAGGQTLSVKSGTGAALSGTDTLAPVLRFSGAGARTAALELVPTAANGAGRLRIALGPDGTGANGFDRAGLGTNVGGGADPHATGNGFDVELALLPPVLTLTRIGGTDPVAEGDNRGARFRIDGSRPLADLVTVNYRLGGTAEAPFYSNPEDYRLEMRLDGIWYTMSAYRGKPFFDLYEVPTVLRVTPLADKEAEGDETVTLSLVAGNGYALGTPSAAEMTIEDAVEPVAASFAEAASSAGEDAGTRSVTVNLDPAPTSAIALAYNVKGTATAAEDFAIAGLSGGKGSVDVAAGQASVSIDVAITDDGAHEGNETVVLELAAGAGYTAKGTTSHTLTILDNDPAVPIVSIWAGPAVTEGGTASFTLTANPLPSEPITVQVAVSESGGFAAGGQTGTRQVRVGTGVTSTLVATARDDADEPNGSVTATIADGAGYAPHATAGAASVAVADDDPTGVTLSAPAGDVAESGGTKVLTVRLGRALAAPEALSVPLVFGGAATRGTDYTLSCAEAAGVACHDLGGANPRVVFTGQAGASRTATLTLAAASDAIDEGAGETVTVALGPLDGISGTNLGGGAAGTGTASFRIADDDTTTALTVAPALASLYEAETSSFTVSGIPAAYSQVRLAASGGAVRDTGGTPGADYRLLDASDTVLGTTHTLTPSDGSVTFKVAALADETGESDETVVLKLVDPSGTLDVALGTLTLKDGPRPEARVTISKTELALDEGGEGRYTVVLTKAPALGRTVLVTVGSGDPGAVHVRNAGSSKPAGASATVPFIHSTWKYPQTVVVAARQDADIADESVVLSHTVQATGEWADVTAEPVTVTVIDDDKPIPVSVSAGERVTEGGAATFTVTAEWAPKAALTVALTVTETGAFAASGQTGSRSVEIAPGETTATLTVKTVNDDVIEPDGAVTAAVAAGTGYTAGDAPSATVAVWDEDGDVAVRFVLGPSEIAESGGTATLTLWPSRPLVAGETLRMPLVLGGTAGLGSDYTLDGWDIFPNVTYENLTSTDPASPPTMVFTGPTSAQRIYNRAQLSLTSINDTVQEGLGETVTVEAGTIAATGIPGRVTVRVVLRDRFRILDDDAPALSVAPVPGVLHEERTQTFTISDIPAAYTQMRLAATGDAVRDTGGTTGADYRLLDASDAVLGASHTLTPSGGSVTFKVQTLADTEEEEDETVTLVLVDPGGVLNAHVGVLTLRNGPRPVAGVAVSETMFALMEWGEAGSYTVALTKAPPAGETVTVTAASGDPGAVWVAGPDGVAGASAALAFTADDWDRPQTVTVTAQNDADTDDESVVIAHTVQGGTGEYADATAASVTVAVTDLNVALPVSVSARPAEMTEGGTATFTVTAAEAPGQALAVKLTVGQRGAFLAEGQAGERTVTIAPASTTGEFTVVTADDGTNEAHGAVTATIEPGPGYAVDLATRTAEVAVRDDDGQGVPEVSVVIGGSVEAQATRTVYEGRSVVFRVVSDVPVAADLRVAVDVTQPGNGYVEAEHTGARTVTIAKGEKAASFRVPTQDDGVEEGAAGTLTATVQSGAGYTVAAAPGNAVSATVVDDEFARRSYTVSVEDATGRESERLMVFTVRLNGASSHPVAVGVDAREAKPVSAREFRSGGDWKSSDFMDMESAVRFAPGETEKEVRVFIFDDGHDEGPETFELVLTRVQGASVADGVAVGTIVNSDPMPAAWLARFGRTVAEQALDGIAGRMAAPRTPGAHGTVAGQAISLNPGSGSFGSGSGAGEAGSGGPGGPANGIAAMDNPSRSGLSGLADFDDRAGGFGPGFGANDGRFGADGLGNAHGFHSGGGQSQTMTVQEALLGSSFTATGETDSSGGSLAFWGRAAQGSFDGREGAFSLDGDATTAMLGADYARGNWLVGLALMQSAGEGGYRDTGPRRDAASRALAQMCKDAEDTGPARQKVCNGAVREGDGKVEASLTAAVPYAALQASERLKLWGALGYGTGEVTLKPQVGGSYKADIDWTMAAAGLRGDVIAPRKEGSGPALAVTSDALWARTSSDKTRDLAASESDVTRLRLGLEGSWRVALEEGGHLTPKLEVGARHDGGDAEIGFGVELGGGIAWVDPKLGLSLDLSGRTLIAHGNDDLEDRGYSASLSYDPAPATKRGPSLTLTQDWGGQSQGGLDALFTPDPLEDRTGSGEAASRWAMEAAYGLPVLGGRFTGSPHVGFGLATAARDYTIGWRLTPEAASAPDLSFGLKAVRRESDAAAAEHSVGFEITARW